MSTIQYGYQAYRQTQAQTSAPGELVVLLYRGAVRHVAAARQALRGQMAEPAHTHLVQAQAILAELMGSLDLERGGAVAEQLLQVYTYLEQRLVEANVRKAEEPAAEVEGHLRALLQAWEQIVPTAGGARPAGAKGPQPAATFRPVLRAA